MIALTESGGGVSIYRLKITLKGSNPPIWRRILVRADTKLERLHRMLQPVMGWGNCHLHQYHIRAGFKQTTYCIPDPNFQSWGCKMHDERRYTIGDLLKAPKRKIYYEYDFGDSWIHDVVLEKILPPDPAFKYPVCLAGANACPPEDCGGLWGYYNLLKVLKDPAHQEHAALKEWIGGESDPTLFDLEGINAALKRMKA